MFGIRKWPVVPTVVVLVAVAIMLRLGVWQLDRMAEEQAKLAQFTAAASDQRPVRFPDASAAANDATHYRRSAVTCISVDDWRGTAGSNARGESGYVQIARCRTPEGTAVDVQAGWSRDLSPPAWPGGTVTGIIAPNRDASSILVADPPLGGMAANRLPMPAAEQPQKNLAYAGQWFFFALTALVIYVLALRRRQRDGERDRTELSGQA